MLDLAAENGVLLVNRADVCF